MGVEPLKSPTPNQLQGPKYLYNNPHVRYISNSEIQTFKDCKRKWWLAYYRGLSPKAKKFLGPLAIGGRIHRALEDYYVPPEYIQFDPRDSIELHIEGDFERVKQVYGDEIPEDFLKQFNKEADLERIMLEGYMQWLEETGADSDLIIIMPEAYIEVPWGIRWHDNKTVLLIGRLDVLVERETDGKRMFIDHKTLADINTRSLVSDEQMLMYGFLVSEYLDWNNYDYPSALYNMLKKVKRTKAAKPPFFNRIEVSYNFYQAKAFEQHLGIILKEIFNVEHQLAHMREPWNVTHHDVVYPRPTRDCAWKCDFYQVCSMFDDGSRVENMLTEHYDAVDPLAYYHKENNDK